MNALSRHQDFRCILSTHVVSAHKYDAELAMKLIDIATGNTLYGEEHLSVGKLTVARCAPDSYPAMLKLLVQSASLDVAISAVL